MQRQQRYTLCAGWLILAVANGWTVSSAEQTFSIGKHGAKYISFTIESDTDLETIVTTTNKATGEVKWDRDAKTGSAALTVPVTGLRTGIDTRDKHLQGDKWLDAAKHPNITFKTTKLKHKKGDQYEIEGNFTMKGKTKKVKAVATVKYVPYKKKFEKMHLPKGNLVRIRTKFEIELKDFGVISSAIPAKVADKLKIKISIMGVNEIK